MKADVEDEIPELGTDASRTTATGNVGVRAGRFAGYGVRTLLAEELRAELSSQFRIRAARAARGWPVPATHSLIMPGQYLPGTMSHPRKMVPKTRRRLVEDGVLVDLTPHAQTAGIRVACGISAAALSHLTCTPPDEKLKVTDGLAAFLLALLRPLAEGPAAVVQIQYGGISTEIDGKRLRGPLYAARVFGDNAEPSLVLVLPSEAPHQENDDPPREAQGGLWSHADIISAYSRAQAIVDGILVDLTPFARSLGFRIPVAITSPALAEATGGSPDDPERLVDLLIPLIRAAAEAPRDAERVDFAVSLAHHGRRRCQAKEVPLYAMVGPGDDFESVLTIMLPEED